MLDKQYKHHYIERLGHGQEEQQHLTKIIKVLIHLSSQPTRGHLYLRIIQRAIRDNRYQLKSGIHNTPDLNVVTIVERAGLKRQQVGQMPEELIVRSEHLGGDVHRVVAVPPVGHYTCVGGED